jgi:hypothetical protein
MLVHSTMRDGVRIGCCKKYQIVPVAVCVLLALSRRCVVVSRVVAPAVRERGDAERKLGTRPYIAAANAKDMA